MTVRVFAPAKINLTLKVGAPRADGLHPLRSVIVFADVGDWIEVSASAQRELHVSGPFAAALGGDNIVLRAMAALADAAGTTVGASVKLEKNLPVASGIGGGSSDAAATLKALNHVWGLNFSAARLMEVAQALGGDVPVCVVARSAFVAGAGEVVAPLDTPQFHAVLVNPLKPLATAAVYRCFDEMGLGEELAEAPRLSGQTAEQFIERVAALGNDLAIPARRLLPEIADVEAALRDDNRVRYVALSGSGATCFALLGTAADANGVADSLGARRPDWWVRAALLSPA